MVRFNAISYSGGLNTKHVQYLNGSNLSGFEYHLNT